MNKQDNKSTLTGLVLIGIIFVLYSILPKCFPYTTEESQDSGEKETPEETTEEETNNEDNIQEENNIEETIITTNTKT